jgi:DNA repair exonuclease SbcCD ATPase subunit
VLNKIISIELKAAKIFKVFEKMIAKLNKHNDKLVKLVTEAQEIISEHQNAVNKAQAIIESNNTQINKLQSLVGLVGEEVVKDGQK